MSTYLTDRALILLFTVCCAIVAPVSCYTVHASLPFNALEMPLGGRSTARTLAPEGWKFFTREAQEPRLFPLQRGPDGDWRSVSFGSNAEPTNWFGLRRISRAQAIEIGKILERVDTASWRACEQTIEACLDAAPVTISLANLDRLRSLCGDVGFVLQRPAPWAWARRLGFVEMPARVLRLVIQC